MQRATLSVTVLSEIADSTVVRALGFATGGAVPGIQISIRRSGSPTEQSATADANGQVDFTQLLPGDYTLSAVRPLTSVERAALDPGDQDVTAFGGGVSIGVSAPTTSTIVRAPAGRRGSLVISEIFLNQVQQSSGNFYPHGMYLELYNNADTAIGLSGKIIVSGFPGGYEYQAGRCAEYDHLSSDTAGIWAYVLYEFPSTAAPIPPGQTVLLATDAIDHTTIATGTYDLTGADFEFTGTNDVDNPNVPDMISLGPRNGAMIGHGLFFFAVREVVAVADTLTYSSLVSQTLEGGIPVVRVPASKVLDVLTSAYDFDPGYPPCARSVAPRFDLQEIVAIKPIDTRALERRVLSITNGRPVLLRTKNSSRDFRAFTPSPGSIQ